MPAKAIAGRPHVIAAVGHLQVALPARYVLEILRVPPCHAVPGAPRDYRGVISVRGKVLPLLDLRLRMGLPSALQEADEMIAMLTAREQDHVRWLKELEVAVREGSPFALARDPAECAFGKWYYNYRPDDIGFASVMYRFEVPHRRIHAIADVAVGYAEKGDRDRAREVILQTRKDDLSAVVALFEEARRAYRESRKELALVLTDGTRQLSVTVDSVAAVEPIAAETAANAPTSTDSAAPGLFPKVAHRADGKGTVLLLDTEALLERETGAGARAAAPP